VPRGLIVGRWDDVIGVVLEAKYPEDVEISSENLMRIFTSHAVGEGQAGFLALRLEEENMNVASYFTGLEKKPQCFFSLILNEEEDARIYEEALLEVSIDLYSHLGEPEFSNLVKEAYEKLCKVTAITDEQRLATIFKDKLHIRLHQLLTEGPIQISQLREILEAETGESIRSIDLLILPLVRSNIAVESWVPGYPSRFIFLVRDFTMLRVPHEETIKLAKEGKLPKEIAKEYLEQVSNFFSTYTPNEADNMELAEVILNDDYYSIIKALRTSPCYQKDIPQILEGKKLGIARAVKELKNKNIVFVAKHDNDNLILLKTDIAFPTFFPEYLLKTIRDRLVNGEIPIDAALTHLDLLQRNYA